MDALPSSSTGFINNRADNFTELWILPSGNYINILQRNKSQTYRLNLFKDVKKPFSNSASPSVTIVPNILSGPRKHIRFPSGVWASW